MLPKLVYSKVIQSLKKMEINWKQDRIDNPKMAPYEIDSSLVMSIENAMREGHMGMNLQDKKRVVQETFEYLVNKGLIVKSPYGGHIFPLPEGTIIPTKNELIRQIEYSLRRS